MNEFILENKEEIVELIKPTLSKFLKRSSWFVGPFKRSHDKIFEELVVKEIKNVLFEHYWGLKFDEIYCMIDKQWIINLTGNYFFDRSNYEY